MTILDEKVLQKLAQKRKGTTTHHSHVKLFLEGLQA